MKSKIVPRIRILRAQTNLTQKDLADLLEVSEGTIANWEKGSGNFSWLENAHKLCKLFDCDISELYEKKSAEDLENEKTRKRLSLEDYRKRLNTDIPSIEDQSSPSIDEE